MNGINFSHLFMACSLQNASEDEALKERKEEEEKVRLQQKAKEARGDNKPPISDSEIKMENKKRGRKPNKEKDEKKNKKNSKQDKQNKQEKIEKQEIKEEDESPKKSKDKEKESGSKEKESGSKEKEKEVKAESSKPDKNKKDDKADSKDKDKESRLGNYSYQGYLDHSLTLTYKPLRPRSRYHSYCCMGKKTI